MQLEISLKSICKIIFFTPFQYISSTLSNLVHTGLHTQQSTFRSLAEGLFSAATPCVILVSQERSAEIRIFFSFAASTFSARCQSVFSLSLLLKVLLVKWSSMSCRRQESRARTVEEAAAIWLLFSTKKNCYNDSLRLLQPRRVITYANTTIMISHC